MTLEDISAISQVVGAVTLVVVGVLVAALALRWGTRWGSTARERELALPGDSYLEPTRAARVVMTRAISLAAPPARVWPWLAQLGRGAGWYSVDWLDNGRKRSARHLVSWIPEARIGDATAIGYLRHLAPGSSLAWWLDGASFLGSRARAVTCYRVSGDGRGARLICRISADATGPTARLALLVFRVIDSIMASRQLVGLRERVESSTRDSAAKGAPETGDRAQYQLYEVVYASGESAGVAGREEAARCRQLAVRDGCLDAADRASGAGDSP